MAEENRMWVLAERPDGPVDENTFRMESSPVPEIGDGEALVRVRVVSIDPTNRMWIGEEPTYLPPVAIGEVMRGLGLGEVVESNNPNFPVGARVQGLTGWQDYAVISDEQPLMVVPDGVEADDATLLGALGMTGATAWFGMKEIGQPKEGETVVVSAAAGAVGSVAGQLAKAEGARVVGIAGGPEKCAWIVDELGFDAAVDYKADDWHDQLKAAPPDGIDVDFENVGGEIMEAVFSRLNINARVVLCGLISGYNDAEPPPGPRSF
ncbi:MAG: NADP-dependent oxidoreductase, partial [Solirubrobacterales bacterium]